MLTRKHFQAAADDVRKIVDIFERRAAAEALAGHFERSNPRFDRDRFFAACGL